MRKSVLLILFAASFCFAQGVPTTRSSSTPGAASVPSQPSGSSPEVAPNAPVITLDGLCSSSVDPKSPDCRTVVTRAEFEHLADTFSPNMPPGARQSLASDYAQMLVIANEARKRGLENTPRFNDLIGFLKLQVLAQELFRTMQDQAKPSATEVEKYYSDNAPKYQQISVKRVFIPRNRPEEATAPKPSTAPIAASKQITDAELQSEGDKVRARLMAGEDFVKLQKEIYEGAGFKTPPPPTSIPNWRRESAPQKEQQLFTFKPKEFSQVMIEPAGAYVYQLEESKLTPLAEVKPQIESMLTRERLQEMMQTIRGGVKPELNQAYFRGQGIANPVPPSPAGNQSVPSVPNSTAPKPK
jgi:hypothetical protein